MLNHPRLKTAVLATCGALLMLLGPWAPADIRPDVDDDLIGTLPVMYPDDDETPTEGQTNPLDAAILLTGTQVEVEAIIYDAYGTGWIEVEPTSVPGQFVYAIHGDVILSVDRAALEAGIVKTGLRLGYGYYGAQASVNWQGKCGSCFQVKTPEMDIDYASVLSSGVADLGAVSLDVLPRSTGQAYLAFEVYGPTVQIELATY